MFGLSDKFIIIIIIKRSLLKETLTGICSNETEFTASHFIVDLRMAKQKYQAPFVTHNSSYLYSQAELLTERS